MFGLLSILTWWLNVNSNVHPPFPPGLSLPIVALSRYFWNGASVLKNNLRHLKYQHISNILVTSVMGFHKWNAMLASGRNLLTTTFLEASLAITFLDNWVDMSLRVLGAYDGATAGSHTRGRLRKFQERCSNVWAPPWGAGLRAGSMLVHFFWHRRKDCPF